MRLVIDCNVFISVCFGSETCSVAVERAHIDHQVFYSLAILQEVETTLRKQKFQKTWFQLTVMSRLAAPPMMKDNGGWVATARSRKEMVAPTLTANEIRRFASYPGLLP